MYCFIDTETTGLNSNSQVLTACFIILNNNFLEIDRLELSIKYNEYNVSLKALEVNKIDLIEHDKFSISIGASCIKLKNFLRKNWDNQRYTIAGHNIINFDIGMITGNGKLLTKDEYNEYFNFTPLDTFLIADFFRISGKINHKVGLSLKKLCEYFSINCETSLLHNSTFDTLMTIELFHKLKNL